MTRHLPILIVILPLLGAALGMGLSRIHRYLCRDIVIATTALSFCMSLMQLRNVAHGEVVRYVFGGYTTPFGIEFYIDGISALVVCLICTVGLLTVLFSIKIEDVRSDFEVSAIYAVMSLLITGMLGMTSTGDVFNLYVFLEVTSLSGYCLIAMGGDRGVISVFRYMLVGTVAATFYLLAVGILYSVTGTLNMQDLASILAKGENDQAMFIAMCFIITAFGIKMALFPFHGWQHTAYTYAEIGASPLITGVMGKVPAYALFRYIFFVYGGFRHMHFFFTFLGVLAVIGMMYGSIRAMGQKNFRKMLAYSSVAQISYVIMGFAVGNDTALAGAILHLVGEAFMKSGLFFAAGAITYKYGKVMLEDFGYIYKKMPLTDGLIVIAALAMIGIPPTVGFASKWYLALGAAHEHHYVYVAVLVISSLLNAVYFFKLLEHMFMGRDKKAPALVEVRRGELPIAMTIPIVVSFAAILLLGIFNGPIIRMLMYTLKGVAV